MISDMVIHQAEGYGLCIVVGVCAGIVGVVINGIARSLRRHCVISGLCDILLWLALSVVVMAVEYICCDGDIRLYIFLGFFSGFFLSFCTINWVVSKIRDYILYHLKNDSEKVKK